MCEDVECVPSWHIPRNCAMYDSQNQYHDVRLEKGNLLDRRPINLLQVHRLQNNHHRNKLK
jgi:hypothetical protein